MSVWAEPIKPGVLTANDVKQYRQVPEAGAFLASAITVGRTKANVGFVITPGTAASNICNVEVRFLDHNNKLVPGVRAFDIFLSDSAVGSGLTGNTASGTVHTKTSSGSFMFTYTSKKLLKVATLPSGSYTLEITDSAKTGFYVCVPDPVTGLVHVSRQLVTADYG